MATACGRIDYGQSRPDGDLPDAASALDAASSLDAGSALDAGSSLDAGSALDAAVDAGGITIEDPCRRNADCTLGGGYCRFDVGTCGGTGTCAPMGVACPPEPMPGTEVCGCDGTTYVHWCYAARGGTSLRSSDGPCP